MSQASANALALAEASRRESAVHVKIEEINKPKLIILLVAVVVNTPAIFIVLRTEQNHSVNIADN
ncbi:hypothetical protein LC613_00645 [Nostoc sphaeroides CHAB 2801]|uniref:hypothetical protein n=1 Tax=Nostoc sphaeroides TaxID=446679 RepID=UPI000E4DDA44|nr:hypothetical protein [Nostoc sphaeroides]MCC5626780.1 hypothetical protein [Nostoc sphaeroides CHAB 2801]